MLDSDFVADNSSESLWSLGGLSLALGVAAFITFWSALAGIFMMSVTTELDQGTPEFSIFFIFMMCGCFGPLINLAGIAAGSIGLATADHSKRVSVAGFTLNLTLFINSILMISLLAVIASLSS